MNKIEKSKSRNTNILWASIIAVTVLIRLFPFLPNFAPVTAIALFAGAYFSKSKLTTAAILGIILVSDILLFFLNGTSLYPDMPFVYASYAIIALMGSRVKLTSPFWVQLLSGIGASVIFFVVSNFGVWAMGSLGYAYNAQGLTQCYVSALAFYREHNTWIADLGFTAVAFGAYHLVRSSQARHASSSYLLTRNMAKSSNKR